MSFAQSVAASTATKLAENPLRRRMHLLQRAHSLTSLPLLGSAERKILPLPEMSHSKDKVGGDADQLDDLSPLEYESRTDSSDDEDHAHDSDLDGSSNHRPQPPPPPKRSSSSSGSNGGSPSSDKGKITPVRPRIDTAFTSSSSYYSRKEPGPVSPTSRAWYEFDLAVVVALVSPVGNWLTGGDHIKNLLLIVLLIFYLHQIIEIPWALYKKARPRKRAPNILPSPTDTPEARYAHLAATELRRLELLFLSCTLISPFLGAVLLRYATAAVLGPEAVSWFSTGLFVLATGMRPWAHLVERLNERTSELHDFIHYPEAHAAAAARGEAQQQKDDEHVRRLQRRLEKLERSTGKLKARVVRLTEEVYEHVDEAVDAVERNMQRQDRQWEECEGKVRHVERVVDGLQQQHGAQRGPVSTFGALRRLVKGYLHWILRVVFSSSVLTSSRKGVYTALNNPNPRVPSKKHHAQTHSATASPTPILIPLETIAEENNIEDMKKYPLLAQPLSMTSKLVARLLYLATMPLRAVLRMILGRY